MPPKFFEHVRYREFVMYLTQAHLDLWEAVYIPICSARGRCRNWGQQFWKTTWKSWRRWSNWYFMKLWTYYTRSKATSLQCHHLVALLADSSRSVKLLVYKHKIKCRIVTNSVLDEKIVQKELIDLVHIVKSLQLQWNLDVGRVEMAMRRKIYSIQKNKLIDLLKKGTI